MSIAWLLKFCQGRINSSLQIDLNGVLQDALGDDVALRGGRRLCTDEDPELWVAVLAVFLQLLLQGAEPLGHQVNVLVGRKDPPTNAGICSVLLA